jgi:D-serine deaminase-like pyridoxal phosphate-dependent protein
LGIARLNIFTSVVSRAGETRGILDAGSKTFTSDTGGLDGFGLIREHPEARIHKMAEEHGFLDLSGCRQCLLSEISCGSCQIMSASR